MKIIDLDADQAARLVPLLQDLHALHVAHQPERHLPEPTNASLEHWLQDWLAQEGITALLAESPQGAPLGYLVYAVEDRPALPIRAAERRIMVHHISVAEPFRRMGVGQALVSEVKRRAQERGIGIIARPAMRPSTPALRRCIKAWDCRLCSPRQNGAPNDRKRPHSPLVEILSGQPTRPD